MEKCCYLRGRSGAVDVSESEWDMEVRFILSLLASQEVKPFFYVTGLFWLGFGHVLWLSFIVLEKQFRLFYTDLPAFDIVYLIVQYWLIKLKWVSLCVAVGYIFVGVDYNHVYVVIVGF